MNVLIIKKILRNINKNKVIKIKEHFDIYKIKKYIILKN